MSRSSKRIPCCKDHNKGMKRCANKKVRRNNMIIPSGAFYKKVFCSYDICDYKFFESFTSYKKDCERYSHRKYTDKELYRDWYRCYKMKWKDAFIAWRGIIQGYSEKWNGRFFKLLYVKELTYIITKE